MPKKIIISKIGDPKVLEYIDYELPSTPQKNNVRIKQDSIGLNYIESTDLSLYFNDNKIQDIIYYIKPNSITTPIKDVKEKDRYLKGFLWRGREQPKNKAAIFSE